MISIGDLMTRCVLIRQAVAARVGLACEFCFGLAAEASAVWPDERAP